MLALIVSSILAAVGLGTLFSLVYPRVDVDLGLASLFALAGLSLVLIVRAAWRAVHPRRDDGSGSGR